MLAHACPQAAGWAADGAWMSEFPQADLADATVVAATTGDERAIGAVWHDLQPGLLRYLRSLGVHDAEDVASTTWLELSRVLADLEPPTVEALRRLLFTIARRRMVDELRRRRTRPDPADIDWDRDVGEADDGGLGAALEHLRSLSPAQAEVIALRVIVGMSAEEVGELTGQSAGAVRVMAHRGLAVLRQRLTQDDELGQPTQIESSGVTNDDQHTIDGVQ